MLTIQHNGETYSEEQLIILELPALLGDPLMEFSVQFNCRSACQQGAPFQLFFGVFTRNKADTPVETIFGVHQHEVDCYFPVDIQ